MQLWYYVVVEARLWQEQAPDSPRLRVFKGAGGADTATDATPMRRGRYILGCVAAAAVAIGLAAPPAVADLVLDLSFGGLDGSFISGGVGTDYGTFTAVGSSFRTADGLTASTAGHVERLTNDGLAGIAEFDWSAPIGSASFTLSLEMTDIDRLNRTAQASGTIVMSDFDGDYILGTVSGSWRADGGVAAFAGTVSPLLVVDITPDSAFNGNLWGSRFSTDFSGYSQLLSATVNLATYEEWFPETGFAYIESSVISQTTPMPAPGALLLGAIGLSLIAWAKKRFA